MPSQPAPSTKIDAKVNSLNKADKTDSTETQNSDKITAARTLANDTNRSVTAIERAIDVLFLFTNAKRPLGVTEIANEIGLSKAVVHRILTSLRERDLLATDPETRRYALGPSVLQIATAYREQLDIRELALEEMRQLSAATNETSTLSVRHGNRRVYVAQITPPREVKMTVPIGGSFPLHAGASSKALLAWLSEGEINLYLANHPLEALTNTTIVKVTELRTELKTIREQGFAASLGERHADAGSVAAPVLDHNQTPQAVISICGPVERMRREIPSTSAALMLATQALSKKLGARGSG